MSRRSPSRARAARRIATVPLVALAAWAGPGRSADPADWSRAFASDSERVVFVQASGALVVAPFHLASAETLWSPPPGDRLARLRVAPDGRRIAWLSRSDEVDSVRLWTSSDAGRSRVRFGPVRPGRFGVLRFEPDGPTLEDPAFEGIRLVAPSALQRRGVSHAFEWTPDASGVVFGTGHALGFAPADSGRPYEVSDHLVEGIRSLDPAAIFLAQVILTSTTGPREGWFLLYPAPGSWKVFPAAGLRPEVPWAASATTVWWANGASIRAVRAHSPVATDELETASPVLWIGFDPRARLLSWVSGSRLERRPEDGGPGTVRLATAQPIEAVLAASRGGPIGIVTADSLIVWDPADDRARAVARGGVTPSSLRAVGGTWIVEGRTRGRKSWKLSAVDFDGGRLVPIESPRVRHPLLTTTPNGSRLILADVDAKPPGELHVLDPGSRSWTTVRNDGWIGWEPLAPR